jgi:hypothetical protein
MAAPLYREPDRPVEGWNLVGPESLGLPFPQSQSDNALAVLELILDRRGVPADPHHAR